MTEALRTLIVDDSVVFRSFMRRCLKQIEGVDVVGIAADGEAALRQIDLLKPDLVTLDMEMPKKFGIEVLKTLQKSFPEARVIIVSSENETDADRTIDALENGACDFILKPKSGDEAETILLRQLRCSIGVSRSIDQVLVGSRRVQKIKASQNSAPRASSHSAYPVKSSRIFRPDVIAIGSSTGGPAALSAVIGSLPAGILAPIVIIQHMPALFVHSLAARLDRETKLACRVIEDGMPLEGGEVYIAPGEIHTEIRRRGMQLIATLVDGPKLHHCKPAVDQTFMSLKELEPSVKTLAVVLTGMGVDGAAGAKAIADAGGYVIAQDQETSTVWGMPGATVATGSVDQVLPLDDIATELMSIDSGAIRNAAR